MPERLFWISQPGLECSISSEVDLLTRASWRLFISPERCRWIFEEIRPGGAAMEFFPHASTESFELFELSPFCGDFSWHKGSSSDSETDQSSSPAQLWSTAENEIFGCSFANHWLFAVEIGEGVSTSVITGADWMTLRGFETKTKPDILFKTFRLKFIIQFRIKYESRWIITDDQITLIFYKKKTFTFSNPSPRYLSSK